MDAPHQCILWHLLPPFFNKVRDMTHKYCYEDCIQEHEQNDCNGNVKKKKILVPCNADAPNVCHCDKEDRPKNWTFKTASGFKIAWITLLILQGRYFGRDKFKIWRFHPEGFDISYVWNWMISNAYEFMRSYIHFADNDKRTDLGQSGYDLSQMVEIL